MNFNYRNTSTGKSVKTHSKFIKIKHEVISKKFMMAKEFNYQRGKYRILVNPFLIKVEKKHLMVEKGFFIEAYHLSQH